MSNEQDETVGGAGTLAGLFEGIGFLFSEDGDGVDVLHGKPHILISSLTVVAALGEDVHDRMMNSWRLLINCMSSLLIFSLSCMAQDSLWTGKWKINETASVKP